MRTLVLIVMAATACGGSKSMGNGDEDLAQAPSVDMAEASQSDLTAASSKKRLFVTKSSFTGNLGGIAGADSKCTAAATAASLTGTWKAWISDGTTSAKDRISDVGPWYAIDGTTLLFDNKAGLTGAPKAFIRM